MALNYFQVVMEQNDLTPGSDEAIHLNLFFKIEIKSDNTI
jgi:hypothetical protein